MEPKTFWDAFGKVCKRRTRTFVGTRRFYYGSMSHVNFMQWRDAP